MPVRPLPLKPTHGETWRRSCKSWEVLQQLPRHLYCLYQQTLHTLQWEWDVARGELNLESNYLIPTVLHGSQKCNPRQIAFLTQTVLICVYI